MSQIYLNFVEEENAVLNPKISFLAAMALNEP